MDKFDSKSVVIKTLLGSIVQRHKQLAEVDGKAKLHLETLINCQDQLEEFKGESIDYWKYLDNLAVLQLQLDMSLMQHHLEQNNIKYQSIVDEICITIMNLNQLSEELQGKTTKTTFGLFCIVVEQLITYSSRLQKYSTMRRDLMIHPTTRYVLLNYLHRPGICNWDQFIESLYSINF